jgi:sec-independent protein translocase protein TatB
MFNFSPEKLFLVGIIALVVLGPHRLPQAARSLGRVLAQFRHMSSNFHDEVRGALAEPVEAVNSIIGEFRPLDVRRTVRDTISSTLTPPSPSSPSAETPAPPSSNGQVTPGLPVAPDDPSLN